jgi:hypothetical protein
MFCCRCNVSDHLLLFLGIGGGGTVLYMERKMPIGIGYIQFMNTAPLLDFRYHNILGDLKKCFESTSSSVEWNDNS